MKATDKFESFEAEVKAASGAYKRRGCSVGLMLEGLNPGDAAKVAKVLADKTLSAMAITAALKSRLPDAPSSYTVKRHRKGECCCQPVPGTPPSSR